MIKVTMEAMEVLLILLDPLIHLAIFHLVPILVMDILRQILVIYMFGMVVSGLMLEMLQDLKVLKDFKVLKD